MSDGKETSFAAKEKKKSTFVAKEKDSPFSVTPKKGDVKDSKLQLDVNVYVSIEANESDKVEVKVWRGFSIKSISEGKELAELLVRNYVKDEDPVRFEPIKIVRYWEWDHTSGDPPIESVTVHTFPVPA